MNKFTKRTKKYLSKRSIKAKAGATLVELVAVVCILAITSTTCISGMFAMTDVAKRGQDLSVCERTSDMVAKQLSVYGNPASEVKSYASAPVMSISAFCDSDHGLGDKNDYFIYADPNVNYRLILAKFTTNYAHTNPQLETVVSIDNVKSISFDTQELKMFSTSTPSDKPVRYMLEYTVTTVGDNIWDKATDKRVEYTSTSGVVMNNISSSTAATTLSSDTIETKTPFSAASTTYIRIRTESRKGLSIT